MIFIYPTLPQKAYMMYLSFRTFVLFALMMLLLQIIKIYNGQFEQKQIYWKDIG